MQSRNGCRALGMHSAFSDTPGYGVKVERMLLSNCLKEQPGIGMSLSEAL